MVLYRRMVRQGPLAVAAVALGLALTSVPAAAKPPATGLRYGGSTSGGDPVVVALSRDHRHVALLSEEFEAKCTSGKGFGLLTIAKPGTRLPISSTGAFRGVDVWRSRLSSGSVQATAHNTVTVIGKVTGTKMSGSLNYAVQIVDAGGATLDTCTQKTTFKAATGPRVFAGLTSQGGPVVAELTATGKAVRHFSIGSSAPCQGGGFLQFGATLTNFTIKAGAFGDTRAGHETAPSGGRETDTYTVKGRLTRTKLSGTVRLVITETDASGAQTDTCDTGTLRISGTSG